MPTADCRLSTCLKSAKSYLFLIVLSFTLTFPSTAQTQWYKYPGNPVFQPGKSGEWDQAKYARTVIFENDQYHMWYYGWSVDVPGSSAIGYASSHDGIHWQKYEANPLEFKCEGVSWDTSFYSFDIIKRDSMYYMWYIGIAKENLTGYIGFAWSDDGLNWTKHLEPVMKPGKDDEWDAWGIYKLKVFFDGICYHMWYNGLKNSTPAFVRILYATSDDGIFWEKHPANPAVDVGESGSWEDHGVGIGSVNFNGSHYEMWYDGFNLIQTETGYATSNDGINWIKSSENPVLKAGELGTWDTWLARDPIVIINDSIYRMWYYGHDNSRGNIGYATTSADEAMAWNTATINKPQKIIKVQVFNRVEYIKVDSLARILPELTGTEFIDACNKLALAYSLNDDEKSFFYAEKALELAEKTDYPKGKAMALYSIGNCQYVMDNFSVALANQLSALWLFDSLNMQFELGNLLSQIAGIHSYAGLHDLACRYHKMSLEVFDRQNDTGFILHSLIYLGYSYLQYGDTNNAIKTFQRRLSLAKEIKDKWKQVDTYEALGLCYAGRILDSALYYFNEANNIWNTLNASGYQGYNFMITAEAYFSAGPEYYNEAEEYFLKSYERFGSGRQMRVRLLNGMAELYFNIGRYDKSKEYLDLSLLICKDFLAKQNHQMFTYLNDKLQYERYLKSFMEKIYRLYYRIYTALKDNDLAFDHFILATQWKDSIYNQQNRRQWAMMQGQYETERAENKITMLETENEVKDLRIQQSRTFIYGMGGFVVVIILMALLFIRQNKVKAEHKSVVLEQKLLRLQMNPHFIFNALSNILNFVNRKDTTNAANYLTSFSRLLRTTLESSREDYILLEEEISSLKNYLDLQLLRYDDKFDYSIEVDENIDIENAIIPPMLIQPFIENAIEHGIRHKETKGKINVRFRLENKKVICEVEDDGVGREKAWEVEYQKRKTHKSLATEIINDRIQSLNKKLKQKISLSIIDLKSDTLEPKGTRVVLNIPYLID